MTRRTINLSILMLAFAGALVPRAAAAEFKSEKECVVGARVTDRSNKSGKIVSVARGMCEVALDQEGKNRSYIFWMLRSEGESAETSDKLVNGRYKCYTSSNGQLQYTSMDIVLVSPGVYENAGKQGKYRVEPSNKIVFESGPLTQFYGKILAGPKIGLNSNGGNFYNTSCGISK